MRKRKHLAVALTIAGSDSGGGAGIQADLKTFAALRAHGVCAITCVTAQNPRAVLAAQPISARMLQRQLDAIGSEWRPRSAKTGMLYSAELVRVAAKFFRSGGAPSLVVDPVMVSTSGARLLEPRAVALLQSELFPLAALITPNLPEAEALLNKKLRGPEAMRSAAWQLQERFGCAVLLKGGHLRGASEAMDIFYDGTRELLLTAPRIRGIRAHGTGCVYSAAITAGLALGDSLQAAVVKAKGFISNALANGKYAGAHFVLDAKA
ncbi:MAG TPA: bifunctional hydroxymethylpyrimidine kinase/phosphomethylpyrimidine kinase [Verrucomicrobiae bacterium]|nr:bifunctional hydroxymethylpyrimidine kinase/phosphomethylpyrimidine kinase [Verrucomicrobiae bacterium]